MIDQDSNLVTENNGPRPAGRPNRCYYCNEPIGSAHGPECVCRRRTVVIEMQVPLVVTVPESWDTHDIEFWANESSSCFNNLISQLVDQLERIGSDKDAKCWCGDAKAIYLREATEQDEKRFAWSGQEPK